MTNIWNKNEIITPISEYNLLYQYNKHVNQVQNIKEQPMNVEKPFSKKKLKPSTSKKLLDIKHPENTENKILVQKILTINNQPSAYALNEDLPIKPSNLGQKILEMRKLIEDNEGIEKRIKQTSSVNIDLSNFLQYQIYFKIFILQIINNILQQSFFCLNFIKLRQQFLIQKIILNFIIIYNQIIQILLIKYIFYLILKTQFKFQFQKFNFINKIYSQKQIRIQVCSFKLIQQNLRIFRNIQKVIKINCINFDKIKQEYKKNKIYLKNLTAHSRRIYNCFVPRAQVPVEVKKKKKVTEKKQQLQDLKRLQQQQPDEEKEKKNNQEIEESNVNDAQQMKSKSNLDQDKLIYQLNELKLKEDCSEQSEDD